MDRVSAVEALRILRRGRPIAALGVRRRSGGTVRLTPGGGPGIAIPIVLFTDFGPDDLYVGQVKAVLAARAPRVAVLDALHGAPDFGVELAAHVLAALAGEYPRGSVFLAVVDPGVGGKRDPIVIQTDGRTFVGPDNGLLSVLWQRARRRKCFRIAWRPKRLTSSFHGRDLFAPVAAALALKRLSRGLLAAKTSPDVLLDPADLAKVIYVDHYGNCVTGMRAEGLARNARIRAGGRLLRYARTFEAAQGPFWYENSMGLVEIAAPRASAARLLGLRVGYAIRILRELVAERFQRRRPSGGMGADPLGRITGLGAGSGEPVGRRHNRLLYRRKRA